jgi:hypothetical protein
MITMPTIGDVARSKKRRANRELAGLPSGEPGARADSEEAIGFVCECRRASCLALVWLAGSHFRLLIEATGASLVAHGHAEANEHVVASSAGYQIVVALNHVTVPDEAVAERPAA